MIWPFKTTPSTTLADEAAKLPIPPCGDGEKHLWWKLVGGMPCPACNAIAEQTRDLQREDRMAGKIAAEIVRRLAAPRHYPQHSTTPGDPHATE